MTNYYLDIKYKPIMNRYNKYAASFRNVILRIFAYELLFIKKYPFLNYCCGLMHLQYKLYVPWKQKCGNCFKYVDTKTFSRHLLRCLKKLNK